MIRIGALKPLPVFAVEADTTIHHKGTVAGQWRWMRLHGDRRKHWWNERTWFI